MADFGFEMVSSALQPVAERARRDYLSLSRDLEVLLAELEEKDYYIADSDIESGKRIINELVAVLQMDIPDRNISLPTVVGQLEALCRQDKKNAKQGRESLGKEAVGRYGLYCAHLLCGSVGLAAIEAYRFTSVLPEVATRIFPQSLYSKNYFVESEDIARELERASAKLQETKRANFVKSSRGIVFKIVYSVFYAPFFAVESTFDALFTVARGRGQRGKNKSWSNYPKIWRESYSLRTRQVERQAVSNNLIPQPQDKARLNYYADRVNTLKDSMEALKSTLSEEAKLRKNVLETLYDKTPIGS